MMRVNSIFIYHGNASTPVSEYRIDTAGVLADSLGCINYDTQPNTYRQSHTRVVKSIRHHTNVDGNASTLDGGFALPPTTFYYSDNLNNPNSFVPLPHFYKGGQECFRFFYMQGYKNGYGGTVSFSYQGDNRSVGSYQYNAYNDYTWPQIGYNYVVSEMRQNDGRNANRRTTYSYTTSCYNQWAAVPTGSLKCNQADAPEYGNIVGHATTTRTSYDYNGSTILHKQITTFSQNASSSLGRPARVDLLTAGNVLLSRTDSSYTSQTIGGIANMFTFTDQVVTTHYHNGGTSANLSTKVTYGYDTSHQGGWQYGNLTHISEFDDAAAATPYRTTRRWFYPNVQLNGSGHLSGHWLVNRVGAEGVYQNNSSTALGVNWTYYDGSTSHMTPPTKGAVTRIRRFLTNSNSCSQIPAPPTGCASLYLTAESRFGYDLFGNQIYQYGSNEYGHRAVNASGGLLADIAPSTETETTTQISYDTTYNLYPVQVVLSGTGFTAQTTSFQIYGFGGVGLTGFQKQRGLLKQVTAANGVTSKYEYDPFGRLYAVYDGFDNFAGFDNTNTSDGNTVSRYLYWDNNWNNATTFLDPAGGKPFIISVVSRPGSYPQPANSSSGYAFAEQTFYDGFGRPIQSRSLWHWLDGQSNSRELYSSTAYHANGQVNCQTVPYDLAFYADRGVAWTNTFDTAACSSKPRTTTYDVLGRPDITTAPDGSSSNLDYAIRNDITLGGFNKLSQTTTYDAHNHATSHFSNSRGQLIAVREFSGSGPYSTYSTTLYGYDPSGNLSSVTDNAANVTGMNYDHFGRKLTMSDPDMGSWTYTYDAAGSLLTQKDANGNKLCFGYDRLNRLTAKWNDPTPADTSCPTSDTYKIASYSYGTTGSAIGQLTQILWTNNANQNKETFAYDTLGRLTTHTRLVDNRSYTLSYSGFDPFHRPTTITYPNGEVVTTGYDHEGANSLTAGADTLINNLTYNVRRQLVTVDRNIEPDSTYSYYGAAGANGNSNYRLQAIQHHNATDNRPDFSYEYDLVGNITKMTSVAANYGTDVQLFEYDHRNRLTDACTGTTTCHTAPTLASGQYNHTYTYDVLGNIDARTAKDGATTTNFNYSYGSRPHAVASVDASSGPDSSFIYDANGNMTSRTEGSTTYTQNFNVENELASVVVSGQTTSFTYDASGIRVKTIKPGGTIVDTPFPNYEVENPTGTPIIRRTYALAGQTIATRISGDPVSGNNGLFFFYNDHLGSASALVKSNSTLVSGSLTRYLPFGGYRGTAPSQTITDRDFTGQRENMELGLLYYQARYYLPGVGRFLSADTIVPNPADPQSYNRYSYVLNSPLNFTDPTGHYECEDAFNCSGGPGSFTPPPTPTPLINFVAPKGLEWTAEEMAVVNSGAWQVARTLYEAGGNQFSSPREAFLGVYGGAVTFEKRNAGGSLGWANEENHVYVNIQAGKITGPSAGSMWAAHELGHAFNYELSPNRTEPKYSHGQGVIDLAQEGVRVGEELISGAISSTSWLGAYKRDLDAGYQSNSFPHIQNPEHSASEDFADMFSNYAYNSFTSDVYGIARHNFMANHMSGWIALAVSNNG